MHTPEVSVSSNLEEDILIHVVEHWFEDGEDEHEVQE